MIEFRFGIFNNTTFQYINGVRDLLSMITQGQMPGFGAQFYNVSKARIYGAEVSTNGVYTFNPNTTLSYNLGYVFIEPNLKTPIIRKRTKKRRPTMIRCR